MERKEDKKSEQKDYILKKVDDASKKEENELKEVNTSSKEEQVNSIKDFIQFQPAGEVSGSTELMAMVNPTFLKNQVQAALGTEVFPATLDAYERQLNQRVQPIMDKINEHIRANAHVEALLLPTIDQNSVDYINMADQLGWVDYLMGQ